jgi:large subunit ribosomal protein L10
MSKYVKDLITDHLRQQLTGVSDAMLVNVIGLSANANYRLRTELRHKDINLVVVKNSLAARAADGTPLAGMFTEVSGTSAICWGAEDVVALAKEVVRLAKDEKFKPFSARGGMVDGAPITEGQVVEVAKWPSRGEQLSILAGQILSPGANLVSQLTSVASALASQIKQKAEPEESAEGEPAAGEAAAGGEAEAAGAPEAASA